MGTGSDHSGSNPRIKLQQVIALDSNRIFFIPPTDGFLSCGFKYNIAVARILCLPPSDTRSELQQLKKQWLLSACHWHLGSSEPFLVAPFWWSGVCISRSVISTDQDTLLHTYAPQPHPAPAEPQTNPQQMMMVQSKAFNKDKLEPKKIKKTKQKTKKHQSSRDQIKWVLLLPLSLHHFSVFMKELHLQAWPSGSKFIVKVKFVNKSTQFYRIM